MTGALFELEHGAVRLLGTRCKQCGHIWFPQSLFGCERCGAYAANLESVSLCGRGTVLALARIPDDSDSFVLARIALDEGPVVRGIIEARPERSEISIGDSVKAFTVAREDKEVIRFRKSDGKVTA